MATLIVLLGQKTVVAQGDAFPVRPVAYQPGKVSVYSDSVLVVLLSTYERQYNWDLGIHYDYVSEVVNELVKRRPIGILISSFKNGELNQRNAIVQVFSAIRGRVVDSAMRDFLVRSDGEATYFALKYFAQIGDSSTLGQLNCRWGEFPVPSIEWAEVVKLFGKYKYYQAAPNLVESLDAGVLNLGAAAQDALINMFPDAHASPEFPPDSKPFWKRYVAGYMKGNGIRQRCNRADNCSC